MKTLSTLGIRLETKTTPVYETQTEETTVNVAKTVTLQDGTTMDILTPEVQENQVQVHVSDIKENIMVIFAVWNDDDNSIEHRSYNANLADYASLQQDFSQQQVDHLISLAGWDITSMT